MKDSWKQRSGMVRYINVKVQTNTIIMIKRLCASLREFESPQGARSRSCLTCNTNNVLLRNYFLALKSKGPI